MVGMDTLHQTNLALQFDRLLDASRSLYVSSGQLIATEHPELLPASSAHFIGLMEDLHQALVVKIFVTICEADRRWSQREQLLAQRLLMHLWGQSLAGAPLQAAITEMSAKATKLKWYALVRPFDQIAPLRDRVGELETLVTRLANVVARVEGVIGPSEAAHVQRIQDELFLHLRQIPIDDAQQRDEAHGAGVQAIEKIVHDTPRLPSVVGENATESSAAGQGTATRGAASQGPLANTPSSPSSQLPPLSLEAALAELDTLIGLPEIKHEVRTLTNFLNVQQQRQAAGLPGTELGLHMVFQGNPGTGKTTVARLLGKVFGAMGILTKGHLIETDRSGLVAEYVGQTGPKANQKIDEALDGVLFIDEAYALVAEAGEDPFGREAVQTLLKRMEDDRHRLIVILAGYPAPMRALLRSNPGLDSRLSRHLDFADYTPLELSQIFGTLCDKNQYQLPPLARAKIIAGLDALYAQRAEPGGCGPTSKENAVAAHFGNGRTVRNLFEQAIRHMANRIVAVANLSVDQLTTLEPEDIEFAQVPVLENLADARFRVECPECEFDKEVPYTLLGQGVRCPKCQHRFTTEWAALVHQR
jgi:adenylate kinase family enzyme